MTLCTQLTFDRLQLLKYQAQLWRGPISAVLYISHDNLQGLRKEFEEDEAIARFVSISVVLMDKVRSPSIRLRHAHGLG